MRRSGYLTTLALADKAINCQRSKWLSHLQLPRQCQFGVAQTQFRHLAGIARTHSHIGGSNRQKKDSGQRSHEQVNTKGSKVNRSNSKTRSPTKTGRHRQLNHKPVNVRSSNGQSTRSRSHNNSVAKDHRFDKQEQEYYDFLAALLPYAPTSLLREPVNLLQSLGFRPRLHTTPKKDKLYSCEIGLAVGKEKLTGIGSHVLQSSAKSFAIKDLMEKLDSRNYLDYFKRSINEDLSQEQMTNGEQALQDVFDYCAFMDVIPEYKAQLISKGVSGRSVYRVSIEVPSREISVDFVAKNMRCAEIGACIEFKSQAEKWHSQNASTPLLVKSAVSLNCATARKFFDFCKVYIRHLQIEISVEPDTRFAHSRREAFSGQVIVNSEALGEPITFERKKDVESVAWLIGAMHMRQKKPELYPNFLTALEEGSSDLLRPLKSIPFRLNDRCLAAVSTTIGKMGKFNLSTEDSSETSTIAEKSSPSYPPRRRLRSERQIAWKNKQLQDNLKTYEESESIAKLRENRSKLPMNQYASKVLGMINENSVCVVVGATGSGKTTQVPQILLEDAIKAGNGAQCNIICTQPRRIAAKSVAERVAVERNEKLQESVGYQVRFESKPPQCGGSILYCTTGVLLQQLRHSEEDALDGVTHIIVDEVHERDIMIDFLLIILRRILRKSKSERKPAFKLILMSATINTDLFTNYFSSKSANGIMEPCPFVSVPGRTFPVKEYYLDDIMNLLNNSSTSKSVKLLQEVDTKDYLKIEQKFAAQTALRLAEPTLQPIVTTNSERVGDRSKQMLESSIDWETKVPAKDDSLALVDAEESPVPTGLIVATISQIVKTSSDGAILVFLPGLAEIERVKRSLASTEPFGIDFMDETKFTIQLLHSSLTQQQMNVFQDIESGKRRIVLSTNIAETSVTIPDVKYIVDSGKQREKLYDQSRRITRLACNWISKSNSKQRAGRAGRVQDGYYYALFYKVRHESFRSMGLPEMLRSDLQEMCLDIKARGFTEGVGNFLGEAIEPPNQRSIQSAIRQLTHLKALNDNESLTPLGKVLSTIPVEPALGKMIILGVIFRCLDPMIISGATSASREIFMQPLDLRREARRSQEFFLKDTDSDHIAMINAFRDWRDVQDREGTFAAGSYASSMFLHPGALRTINETGKQIQQILIDSKIISASDRRQKFGSQFGSSDLNENSHSIPLIKALIFAGHHPNVAVKTTVNGRGFRTANEDFTMIHPRSLNYSKGNRDKDHNSGDVVVYSGKSQSSDGKTILLGQTTFCDLINVILFSGNPARNGSLQTYDKWIPIETFHFKTQQYLQQFRRILNFVLQDAFANITSYQSGMGYISDNPARQAFASDLVNVLELATSSGSKNLEKYSFKRNTESLSSKYTKTPQSHDSRSFLPKRERQYLI